MPRRAETRLVFAGCAGGGGELCLECREALKLEMLGWAEG